MRKETQKAIAIILCVLCGIIVLQNVVHQIMNPIQTKKEASGELEENLWNDEIQLESDQDITVALQEAMLGNSTVQKKLEVYSQEITDITKITDDGNLPFGWSKKYQYVTYTGIANYFWI